MPGQSLNLGMLFKAYDNMEGLKDGIAVEANFSYWSDHFREEVGHRFMIEFLLDRVEIRTLTAGGLW